MKKEEKTTNLDPTPKTEEKKKSKPLQDKKIFTIVLAGIAIFTTISFGVALALKLYKDQQSAPESEEEQEEVVTPPEEEQEATVASSFSDYRFADYELETIDIIPSVTEYTIEPDLSNVYFIREPDTAGYYDDTINQELSQNQKDVLANDWFIVVPKENKEFFSIYESNRYDYVPSFITTDSILHTYHLLFDSTLKNLEEAYLYEQDMQLTKNMVEHFSTVYENAEEGKIKVAAKRNLGFFSVAAKLFDPDFPIPEAVKTEVEQELNNIEAHSAIEMSPVMAIGYENPNPVDNLKEDYTQYVPRGHYTKTEELKRYFNGQMWLGRMTFLTKDETTTLSAFLITEAMAESSDILTNWENVFAPITFFVGKADDLTYYDYVSVYNDILKGTKLEQASTEQIAQLCEKAKELTPPEINSIPVFESSIQEDREEEIKGFRFMGQRFTIDAMIFQRLLYREVGDKTQTCQSFDPSATGCFDGARCLPKALDIPATMGSSTALDLLIDMEEDKYACYSENMSATSDYLADLDTDIWTQNLYWSWMYTLKANIGDAPANYPQFMQTEKWEKKELNTFVASWTELKHDTILYSKQAYSEMGSGGPMEVPDDKGYVEPNIELWNRLLALTRMTKDGLIERGIIQEVDIYHTDGYSCSYKDDVNERMYCNLMHMEEVVDNLLEISKKELTETPLTEEEYEYIRYFGGDLEDLFMSSLEPDSDRWSAVEENPAMLVADVATDPNGVVLEEGTGYINEIYVIVPVEGELRIAKGAVYSQYEFEHPMDDRLTDEAWREMLENGETPEMSDWQKSLITEE